MECRYIVLDIVNSQFNTDTRQLYLRNKYIATIFSYASSSTLYPRVLVIHSFIHRGLQACLDMIHAFLSNLCKRLTFRNAALARHQLIKLEWCHWCTDCSSGRLILRKKQINAKNKKTRFWIFSQKLSKIWDQVKIYFQLQRIILDPATFKLLGGNINYQRFPITTPLVYFIFKMFKSLKCF